MKRDFARREGLAILEAALAIVVLLSACLGVLACYDQLQRFMIMSHLLDELAYDQGVKAYRLRGEGIELAEENIRLAGHELLEKARSNIASKFNRGHLQPNLYLLEVDFAALNIDSQSGKAVAVERFPGSKIRAGDLVVPQEILNEADLSIKFERLVSESEEGPSLYAIPIGTFGNAGQEQYLSRTVLLGVRAFYSTVDSFSANIMQTLGWHIEPLVYDSKVVSLRGEVN